MKLVTYKKRFGRIGRDNMMDVPSEIYERSFKDFDSFPKKEEYQRMGFAAVAHPMGEDKILLHQAGNYNPLYVIDNEE